MLEADEAESESDDDSDSSNSDSDEENEVERTLGEDLIDTAEEGAKPPRSGRAKRKRGQGVDADGDWAMGGNEPDEGVTRISFDIYLKGNVAKTTSFFKSAEGQTQRFRMFPYVEKKRRVDEYGETVDVGMWLRKGKALEEDTESEEVKEAKKRKEEEEAKVRTFPSTPSRILTMTTTTKSSENTSGAALKIRDNGCGSAACMSAVFR